MPSVTLSQQQDKDTVIKAVPTSKIYTAAVARLYVASPDPAQWTYSQVWGAAVFCSDRNKNNAFFIRIVDLMSSSGVIWEQELYQGFEFIKDAPFFYSFDTDDCIVALEFADDSEATTFNKKIQDRESLLRKELSTEKQSTGLFGANNKKAKRRSKIDKNHIGMPADFRHVGHIGYTPGKGFSVQNNDPEYSGLFEQLKELGISAEEINDNQEFIQEYLQNQKEQQQIPPQPPQPHQETARSVPRAQPTRHHPPPPPPPRKPKSSTPPPPPPPSRHYSSMKGRPVPPPPPARNYPTSSIPSPATNRPTGAPPAPPAPPPPPPMSGGAPPPPPPPPAAAAAAAPAPSVIPSNAPAPDAGRANLMAAIRSTGGFGSLKQSGKLKETEGSSSPASGVANTAAAAAGAGAGGNLASSLADVLKQRKQAMQSDDEEEDDDEWD